MTAPASISTPRQSGVRHHLGQLVSCNLEQMGRGYRPAMDGFRGLFVIFVVAYHFGATWLVGGWIGINHFFVFSGYLIGTLLIKERYRTGTIRAVRFYLRRARRIIPALTVLVLAVLVHSALTDSGNRARDAGDGFASLTFWLNWRLIARDDQYFNFFEPGSPLRHVWTLAVEEQFYVVIPFVLLAVFALFTTRVSRGLAIGGIALASAVWTAVIAPDASLSRLYYGTDVRMQAILIGVAAAALHTAEPGGTRFVASRRVTEVLGWFGLVVTVSSFFLLGPYSLQVFSFGGMFFFAIITGCLGLAAVDSRDLLLTRIMSWRPLVHLGQISYGLYLYHWPIGQWVTFDGLPRPLAGVLQFGLTWVISVLSYRFIEIPIMLGGVKALMPWKALKRGIGFIAWGAAVIAALVASLVLPNPVSTQWNGTALPSAAAYAAPTTPLRLAVVGNSIPESLVKGFLPQRYPNLIVLDHAGANGCGAIPVESRTGTTTQPDPAACPQWREEWPGQVKTDRADAVLAFVNQAYAYSIVVDGQVLEPRSEGVRAQLRASLDAVRDQTKASGARQLQLVNAPCWDPDLRTLPAEIKRTYGEENFHLDPTWLNAEVSAWVREQPASAGVRLLDLDAALCSGGYRPEIGGNEMYSSGLHFTVAGAGVVWSWLAPQSVQAWTQRSAEAE